jgi:hypothetical protein
MVHHMALLPLLPASVIVQLARVQRPAASGLKHCTTKPPARPAFGLLNTRERTYR